MNLVERARLTGAEIKDRGFTYEDLSDYRYLTDAQLAKALWAVADWLYERSKAFAPAPGQASALAFQVGFQGAAYEVKEQLEAAGIERPQAQAAKV